MTTGALTLCCVAEPSPSRLLRAGLRPRGGEPRPDGDARLRRPMPGRQTARQRPGSRATVRSPRRWCACAGRGSDHARHGDSVHQDRRWRLVWSQVHDRRDWHEHWDCGGSLQGTRTGSICFAFTAKGGHFQQGDSFVPTSGTIKALGGTGAAARWTATASYALKAITGTHIEKFTFSGAAGQDRKEARLEFDLQARRGPDPRVSQPQGAL